MKFRPWDTLLINIMTLEYCVVSSCGRKQSHLQSKNHWIVEKGQGYLLEHAQPIRSFIEAPKTSN